MDAAVEALPIYAPTAIQTDPFMNADSTPSQTDRAPTRDEGAQCVAVLWPSISNALTGVRAKEISKSRFPVFPNFSGLDLGCIEAKFCK